MTSAPAPGDRDAGDPDAPRADAAGEQLHQAAAEHGTDATDAMASRLAARATADDADGSGGSDGSAGADTRAGGAAVPDDEEIFAEAAAGGPMGPVPPSPQRSTGASGPSESAISGSAVRFGDRLFKGLAAGAGGLLLVVMAAIAIFLVWKAWPAIKPGGENVGNLFTTQTWRPQSDPPIFGIAALLFGTLASSLIAMVIGVPIAIGIALFISHYAPRRVATVLGGIVDLLAAVPSLVYGMWGLYFLIPKTQGFQSWLNQYFGWTYLFGYPDATQASDFGQSLLMAGIVLAIMILPVVSAVCREVFLQTPRETIDAAWALGATKWETIRTAVLPFGRAGMISAAMLGLGRALGETIAVALVLSSGFAISWHLLEPGGDTFASTIALKFGEASSSPLGIPALIAAGLFLFGITLVVNSIARAVIAKKKDFVA